MMTVTESRSTETRCTECGTIRIVFDPPLELEETDEIFQDKVWVVYKHEEPGLGLGPFDLPMGFFWTESSAQRYAEELRAQGDQIWYESDSVDL